MSTERLNEVTRETFSGLEQREFELVSEAPAALTLELREANALGGDSDRREPFSLIFMGPLDPVLPQAIHRLRHPDLGVLDLFLVPVGPDRDQTGIQYEAVFS